MFARPSSSASVLFRVTAFLSAGLIFILAMAAQSVELHNFLHGHPPDASCDDPLCIVDGFASGKVLSLPVDKVIYPPRTDEKSMGFAAVALLASAREYLKMPGRDPPAAAVVVTY